MPIPSRRSPSSIRRRLFVSYAVLSSLLVTVATGVPLALYAARMIQAARSEMIDRGTTLENVVAAVHDPTHPISPSMLARLVYADPRMRGRSRPLLIVDNIGAKALDLCVSGRTVDTMEAHRMGLVTAANGDPSALAEAFYAEHIASLSGSSLRFAERAARATLEPILSERLDAVERMYLDELMKTPDAVQGIEGFLRRGRP